MARLARALPIAVSLALFAFSPAASAHHHHHDWNDSGDQQWQQPIQGDVPETPQDWAQAPVVRPQRPEWQVPEIPLTNKTAVPGKKAMMRKNGKAAIPRSAPKRVQAIIAAANRIIGKPYKWGGGHGRLYDAGYDCSGSVSYALIGAGQLGYAMVSGSFAHWGVKGAGKYVTVFANRGHVYMEVAGLRLDTSSVGDPRGKSGVRWRPVIGRRASFAVRHIAGL